MTPLFIKILNMSISASWLMAVVILLRLIFRRMPGRIRCILWAVVGLRLICPWSIETALSFLTVNEDTFTIVAPAEDRQYVDVHTGFSNIDTAIEDGLNDAIYTAPVEAAHTPMEYAARVAGFIWIGGAALIIIYAIVGYIRMRIRVAEAVPAESIYESDMARYPNAKETATETVRQFTDAGQGSLHAVMVCDSIETPFIFGFIMPKIYLPSSVTGHDLPHVLAHECAHICRRDHVWKLLGYLCLTLHWFNPLVWVSYILLGRDIEAACDERVVSSLDMNEKKNYATALLNCSMKGRPVLIYPIAFGETGVKERVKGVLNYKKPGLWITVAGIFCVAVAVFFMTKPKADSEGIPIGESVNENYAEDFKLIRSYIDSANARDVDAYIDLFAGPLRDEMNDYVVNNGADSFFSAGHMELVEAYRISDDLVSEREASYADVSGIYDEYGVYYIICDIEFDEQSDIRISGRQREQVVIVNEEGAHRLYRISAAELIDGVYLIPVWSVDGTYSEGGVESAEPSEPSKENAEFIALWANAFAGRDGAFIRNHASDEVIRLLEARELLSGVSFGWSSPWPMWEDSIGNIYVAHQDDYEGKAEIVYYAMTSDPHVTAWCEDIAFEITDDGYVVTDESLEFLDDIDSLDEYERAYPYGISGTPMDYMTNGLGEALSYNTMLSSSLIYRELTDPVTAARYLLNLSDDEDKVRISVIEDDSNTLRTNLRIYFAGDDQPVAVSMMHPNRDGICVPENYISANNAPEHTETEYDDTTGGGLQHLPYTEYTDAEVVRIIDRVLTNEPLSEAYPWNFIGELTDDSDIIIKMAEDSSGRYQAYGLISAELGAYGIILNDRVDGHDNLNYVYTQWYWSSLSALAPHLMWTTNGNLVFTYPAEAGKDVYREELCFVDCGYETAHMELIHCGLGRLISQAQDAISFSVDKSTRMLNIYDAIDDTLIAAHPIPEDVDADDISDELSFDDIRFVSTLGTSSGVNSSRLTPSGEVVLMIFKGVDINSKADPYLGYLTLEVGVNLTELGVVDFTLTHPGTYGGTADLQ